MHALTTLVGRLLYRPDARDIEPKSNVRHLVTRLGWGKVDRSTKEVS